MNDFQVYDLIPRLLHDLFTEITGVRLIHSRPTLIQNPPLGTLGGAGRAQPIVAHSFMLCDARGSDLLETAAQRDSCPFNWSLEGMNDKTIPVLMWRIVKGEPIVILYVPSESEMPYRLDATFRQEDVPATQRKSFTWYIFIGNPPNAS